MNGILTRADKQIFHTSVIFFSSEVIVTFISFSFFVNIQSHVVGKDILKYHHETVGLVMDDAPRKGEEKLVVTRNNFFNCYSIQTS